MSRRQITIKPTCMREILSFPKERTALLWEKINQLVTDPVPDGKVKKRLKGAEDICRLRVGEHRVLYRFADEWVCLLGVRPRRDVYRELPETGDAPVVQSGDDDLDALLEPPPPPFVLTAGDGGRPLPFRLTREWLTERGVPAAAQAALRRCRSEDDLLAADVPADLLDRVLDAIFPPPLAQVARQPDLLVPSTDDLVRYREGDLLGFLLALDDDQVKLTRWALQGPTMVTGGAGTGKSTVALYRVKAVLERPEATGHERVLVTTYTQALIAVTRQLLAQILSPDQLARVQVSTCDQIAREIVASRRPLRDLETDRDVRRRLSGLRRAYLPATGSAFEDRLRTRALARLSDDYLLEEIDWIITGRGLTSLNEYLEAPRPGRGVAFNGRVRTVVWELAEALGRTATGERFASLRNEARAIVTDGRWTGHWDHVFVDEAQDLSPAGLALMAEVCERPEGLFFVADSKQSLYSRSYTWTAAHPRLQFRGRTAALKRNYRSTREIEQAAFSMLTAEEAEGSGPSSSVHEGPLPVLLVGVGAGREAEWIGRFVRQMARHLHLRPDAAAVLVPTAAIGQRLATELTGQGLPARFFTGPTLDLRAECVKVMTLHAAKGLEFPIVVVGGLEEGTYPVAEDFDDPDLFAERMRHERRRLYVGLTRAMRGLALVVLEGCAHRALLDLDRTRWHVESAA